MDVYIWSKNTKYMPLAESVRDKKKHIRQNVDPYLIYW